MKKFLILLFALSLLPACNRAADVPVNDDSSSSMILNEGATDSEVPPVYDGTLDSSSADSSQDGSTGQALSEDTQAIGDPGGQSSVDPAAMGDGRD